MLLDKILRPVNWLDECMQCMNDQSIIYYGITVYNFSSEATNKSIKNDCLKLLIVKPLWFKSDFLSRLQITKH